MSARCIIEVVTASGVSALPGGYRIEGAKYWVAPDGELHRCDDHADWAAAEFDLPDDQNDGGLAGENIVHARDNGYVDVRAEREASTGEQYVYVRKAWSSLTNTQREAIKKIAEGRAALVIDDTNRRPVEVYDARGLRTGGGDL